MWPVIKRFVHDLLFSPERATLWFRGIATWIATAAASVVAYPVETIQTWKFRDWLLRWAICSVGALAVMKKAGDKNVAVTKPPDPAP